MAFLCVSVSLWFILPAAAQYSYRVVKTYPHDRTAFTQGLEYRDGFLYEGTGLTGRSSLRKVELATGRVIQRYDLPQPFFGEGITVVNQQILELTWQSQTGFIYDKSSFRVVRSFNYPGEGLHDEIELLLIAAERERINELFRSNKLNDATRRRIAWD